MDYVNILKSAYKQLGEDKSQSLLIRGTARAVLLAAGLHIADELICSLGTVDILLKRMELNGHCNTTK
jgi:hypothetical protein